MNDRYLPAAVWTYPDAIALFIGGLLGSLFALSFTITINGGEQLSDVGVLGVSSVGSALITFAILLYLSRSRGTGTWDLDFGLRFESSDALGLLYGMGLQIGVVLLVQLPLLKLLNLDNPPEQSVAQIAGEASSIGTRAMIVFIVVVLAPLTEELLYRGVLLSRLRRDFTPHVAVVTSAAVFAGIHLIDPNAILAVPGLFVIGLVLGYLALRTNRIGLTIATHAGVNLLAAIAILAGLDI